MPTRNDIIAELSLSKDFNDCISKMEPVELQDDLRMEVLLILLESKEDIIGMHKRNELRFYAVRIILNLIKSNTSPFYKKYRGFVSEYRDDLYSIPEDETVWTKIKTVNPTPSIATRPDDLDLRLQYEQREEMVMQIIDELYWYDKEILKLYMKLGNYRAIEKETNIKWQSCYDTVQATLHKIRYEIRKRTSATTAA